MYDVHLDFCFHLHMDVGVRTPRPAGLYGKTYERFMCMVCNVCTINLVWCCTTGISFGHYLTTP